MQSSKARGSGSGAYICRKLSSRSERLGVAGSSSPMCLLLHGMQALLTVLSRSLV